MGRSFGLKIWRDVAVADTDKPELPEQEKSTSSEAALMVIPKPMKTPMYEADNAVRYLRQERIKEMQKGTNSRLLCYVAGAGAGITRDDVLGIGEMLHNVPRGSNIDFLLHTGGGDIDAAEKIVSMLRAAVGKEGRFRVVVPDFAKSAGTLIGLAADRVLMSDCSELGPIDPQFSKKDGDGNVRWHSILNYLNAYDIICAQLRDNPDDLPAKVMLSKLDPTTVVQFEAIKRRARMLAEQHLNRWMFHSKGGNYTKI